jgi:hypothetical protein
LAGWRRPARDQELTMTRSDAGAHAPAASPCPPIDDDRRPQPEPGAPAAIWSPARPAAALHAIARMPDLPAPRFVPDAALL